jgi:hypothetical protein
MPIYLVHLNILFTYKGSSATSTAAQPYDVGRIIYGQTYEDRWVTDGVIVGDSFKIDWRGTWGIVESVEGDHQVTLAEDYPPAEGDPYTFRRQITFYFSDRILDYNGINYEDYLFDLPDVAEEIQNLGGYDNAVITLRFKNQKIRGKNYLIELFDDYPIENQYVEIYKLYHEKGEIYASDVSTKIFKGVMGQPYDITDFDFKVDCNSMLFAKNLQLPLQIITNDDYPKADPDVIGRYRNIIYGDCEKVICPWTYAGWASTLTADITASAMGMGVSEAPTGVTVTFTAIIDNEEVRVSAINGTSLTFSSRGYNSTTATSHSRGSIIYEKLAYFQAEVAQHPVKYIGHVFVKRTPEDEWLRVIDGYSSYTNSSGRSYIQFTDRVKFDQSINITAETIPDEGSHQHNVNISGAYSSEQEMQSNPTGSSGPYGHSYVTDGNTSSYCALPKDSVVQATFNHEEDRGTISFTYVYVYKNDTSTSGYVRLSGASGAPTLSSGAGWYRLTFSGGSWRAAVSVVGGTYGNQIGEIYKVVKYIPYSSAIAEAHPATGVNVAVNLRGNSAANMVIGDLIAADVEGYEDSTRVKGTDSKYYSCILSHEAATTNRPISGSSWATYWTLSGSDGDTWATRTAYVASGAYTGTADTLIERPDHVRKHILCALLGFDLTTDINASFATVGAVYATRITGGYKLTFVMHEISTEAMDLFKEFDLQTRSNMYESGGVFNLHFSQDTSPASALTFNKDNIRGLFKFGKTEIADIRNVFRGYYYRDYSKSGSLGDKYIKNIEVVAYDSQVKYDSLPEDVEFSCVGNNETMVEDVIDWISHEKKDIRKTVEFNAKWDADILQGCDHFYVHSNFWSNILFKVIKWQTNPSDNTVSIRGIEYFIPPLPLSYPSKTYLLHTATSPIILVQGLTNGSDAVTEQTATSPQLTTRIGTPASATQSQSATSPKIGYFTPLVVNNATQTQTSETPLIDSFDPFGATEIFPPPYSYVDMESSEPILLHTIDFPPQSDSVGIVSSEPVVTEF